MELGNSLVAQYLKAMPESVLAAYFADQDAKQISFTLSYSPPWQLPSERSVFLGHTHIHQLDLPNEQTLRMSLMEQVLLRQTALEIVGNDTSDAGGAAYKLFKWVGDEMKWGNSLGKSPIAVMRSRKANYAQAATIFGLLARSLFIPVRFIDEVAFAPSDRVDALTYDWASMPLPYRLWYGECFWYHIWCEVYLDDCWTPCDPVTGLWGVDDSLIHLRCPDMLKIVVRFRDMQQKVVTDLRPKYTLEPLGLHNAHAESPIVQEIHLLADQLALPLDQPLHRCRELYQERITDIRNFVDLVDEWQSICKSDLLTNVAYDSTHDNFWDRSLVRSSVHAVYGPVTWITDQETLCGELLESVCTLIMLAPGKKYTAVEKECIRDWVESGGNLNIFYGSWGNWLDASVDLMKYFGVVLSDPLDDSTATWRGKVVQDGVEPADEDELELVFAHGIGIYPPDATRVLDSTSQNTLLVKFTIGQGSLLVAPASILTKSTPYTQSYLSSSNRRVLRRILK